MNPTPWNARQAYDGLAEDVNEIKGIVKEMQATQLKDLRDKAEAPSRWLFAIAGPVGVAVIVSILTQTHLLHG